MSGRRPRDRPRAIGHWLMLGAATLATWAPIAFLYLAVEDEGTTGIAHAEFTPMRGDTIPGSDAAWESVDLPDDWRKRLPATTEGWYRLRLASPPPDDGVVYLPVVMMNAAVYWNGELVGAGGRFEDPVARNWNRPLLFPLTAAGGRPDHTLLVRVKSDLVDAGFLGRVHVGHRSDIEPAHDRARLIRRTLLAALIIARLVVGLATAAIWAMWRKETYYGWFSLCMLAWVLAEVNLLVVDIPVSTSAWYWLTYVAIGWWAIFAVRLVLSFVRVSKPGAEQALTTFGIIGSAGLAILAALESPYFHPIATNVWLPLAFLASCTAFRGVLPLLHRQPDEAEFNVVFVVTLSVVGCVLFDLLVQLGLRPRGGISVPAYASMVAITGIGWVLLRRFVGALGETRALATGLEDRVREKHAELERSYAAVRAADRARVLAAERERFLGDVNQGLGSKLVTTLAMAEQPGVASDALADAVRGALDDLRLVIDSLDPVEGELLPALGTLRRRMEPRLAAAGVRIAWDVEDLPPLPDFGPEKLLAVLRIFQDAFSRALGRRGERTLTVRARTDGNAAGRASAVIEIDDTGNGGAKDAWFEAMRARAQAIGADFEIVPSSDRQTLRLSIPCTRPLGTRSSAERGS